MFRFLKFHGFQHPSDETLLGYLDGEIGARRSRGVAAHLDACWACRLKRDRLEHVIDLIMATRPAAEQAALPPRNWSGFEERLAEERNFLNPFQDLLARWSFVPGLAWRYASLVTTIMLAIAAWLYLGSSVALSASEVLRRAGHAQESRLLGVNTPVTYQKLVLRRRSSKAQETEATVELWREAGTGRSRHSGADVLWRDVEGILQANRMDTSAPLSAAAYASWCAGRHARATKVSLSGGEEAFSIESERPDGDRREGVVRVALLVRASDWHPVQGTLQVRTNKGSEEYRVSEVAFDVRPSNSVDRALFREAATNSADLPAPAPTRRERGEQISAPAFEWNSAPWRPDPENVEMEARYALHRAHACLGEAVEVVRRGSAEVVVRGVVQTTERRQDLVAALLATPVKVELETADAVAERILARSRPAGDVRSHPKVILPLQPRLEEYFAERGAREAVGNAIVDLSNRAVSQGQEILEQAWALRRLELAYSPERERALPSPARRLLQQMLREHAAALHIAARSCRETLMPFFSSLPNVGAAAALPPAKVDASISDLLASARDAEAFTGELFAGTTDERERPEMLVDELVRNLTMLESRTAHLEAALAQGTASFAAGLK